MKYPLALYRKGKEMRLRNEFDCDFMVAADEEAEAAAKADGWHETPEEAYADAPAKKAAKKEAKQEEAAPEGGFEGFIAGLDDGEPPHVEAAAPVVEATPAPAPKKRGRKAKAAK